MKCPYCGSDDTERTGEVSYYCNSCLKKIVEREEEK